MNEKQVAELFVEQQVLQPSQAEDVLNEANLNGKTIVQAMVDSGFVDESGFYRTIAEALGAEYVDFGDKEIAPAILKLIPSGLARLHRALPIGLSGNTLRVALADPLDPRFALRWAKMSMLSSRRPSKSIIGSRNIMAPTLRAWRKCSSNSVRPAKCYRSAATRLPRP